MAYDQACRFSFPLSIRYRPDTLVFRNCVLRFLTRGGKKISMVILSYQNPTTRGYEMGPTKVITKSDSLLDVRTGKLIKNGLSTRKAQEEYALRHYLALPVQDNSGRLWSFNGKAVYCLRGSRYETSDDEVVHLSRCHDCGGMCIPADELAVERGCIRCTQCGHEFETRLEMMES